MVGVTARMCSWQLPVKSRQQVTKQVAWRTRSIRVGVRLASHEADRLVSANQSAQQLASCPATHPRSIRLNYRATAENQPGNVRATSRVASREIIHAASNESSGCLPGKLSSGVRATSRQCPAIATLQSRTASTQGPQTRSVRVQSTTVPNHNPKDIPWTTTSAWTGPSASGCKNTAPSGPPPSKPHTEYPFAMCSRSIGVYVVNRVAPFYVAPRAESHALFRLAIPRPAPHQIFAEYVRTLE